MKFFSLLTAVLGLSLASTVQAQSTDDLLMNSAYSTSLGTVVGSEVTYHFQLSNIGVDPVTFLLNEMTVPVNHTFVRASVPTGTCMVTTTDVECTDAFTLNGGSTETYSFTFTTGTAICPLTSLFYANAVVISGTDTNSTNNGGTATATFDCIPSSSSSSSSSFSSSSSSGGFDPNNFLMDSAYSTSVGTVVGSQVTYFFQLSNNGAYPVTFLLNDMTVPAGHTFVSASVPTGTCMVTTTDVECTDAFALNGGSTETYSFTFNTDSGTCPLTPSFYANAVVISGTDTNSTNNGGTATASLACVEPDVSLTAEVSTDTPQPGDTIELTYTLTNIGNIDLTDLFVNTPFPSNLEFISATASFGSFVSVDMEWEVPDLAQLEVVTLVIVARVPVTEENTVYELNASILYKGDVNTFDNSALIFFTSTTVPVASTGGGGGGGGGRRSGGLPSASFGGLAEAAFGGLEEVVTTEELESGCLVFEPRNPVFSDVANSTFLRDISLWGQTKIAATGERLITGYNNHSTQGDTTLVFNPSANVNRMQAAKMILVAHCISIPATIPVPTDGFEFTDLPVSTSPNNSAEYFAARVMYTAYNNGIVLGRGGKMANPFADATFIEVLAMMLRIDQPSLEDGQDTWYSTYLDFAETMDLTIPTSLSSSLRRDMFLNVLTTSARNGIHEVIAEYIETTLASL